MFAAALFASVLASSAALSQPVFLIGVDGSADSMIRVDFGNVNPTIEDLGRVFQGGVRVQEMEAMAWDANLGRVWIASNIGAGPLVTVNLSDISATPPAPIPASFVGNTLTSQLEGIALQPQTRTLFGVDNSWDPARLVTLDQGTGAITTVIGRLRDADGHGYDNVEALAFTQTQSPVLYGADNPSDGPGMLVSIDAATAEVTPIGLGIGFPNVECLAFAPDGKLYGFSNGDGALDQFITIDLATGVGTLVATSNPEGRDIEGCAFIEFANWVLVGVESTTWTHVKSLYQR